jgi:hypothetical protein
LKKFRFTLALTLPNDFSESTKDAVVNPAAGISIEAANDPSSPWGEGRDEGELKNKIVPTNHVE